MIYYDARCMRAYASSQDAHSRFTLGLHSCLDGINGGKNDPECSGSEGDEYSLNVGRKSFHVRVRAEECENPGVGCGITKSRYGALYEGSGEPLVVACPSTVIVQGQDSFACRRTKSVLVVHDSANRLPKCLSTTATRHASKSYH